MKLKKWHVWLGVIISVVFLYLAFRKVDFSQVWIYLRQAQWGWVLLGLVFYFAGVVVRAFRWQVLLKPLKFIPVKRLFPVVAIGYMGNNVYPARAGELLRSVLLKQKEQVEISASLATIVVERLFDALVIFGLVILNLYQLTALPSAQNYINAIRGVAIWGSLIFLLLLLLFFALVLFPVPTKKFTDWIISHLVIEKLRPGLTNILEKFIKGLSSLRSATETLKVLALSIAVWTCETGLYWGVMKAMGIDLSFMTLMLLNGVVNLVLLIPAAPGGLGTFDAACKAMLEVFGIGSELALGYTLLLRVALWVPITVLGAIYFFKEGFSLSTDLQQLKTQYETDDGAPASEPSGESPEPPGNEMNP
ncbi:MAG: lysylphosphatidylglycerol synthase transmembrane domain-containing protein [Anaerolineaceae bacterium]